MGFFPSGLGLGIFQIYLEFIFNANTKEKISLSYIVGKILNPLQGNSPYNNGMFPAKMFPFIVRENQLNFSSSSS
jgi:hypothetical protein